GYTFPLLRYLQRQRDVDRHPDSCWPMIRRVWLAACLSGVALLGTWGAAQWAPSWANSLAEKSQHAKEWTQIVTAWGAIIGTMLAALLGDWIGRRPAYCWLCVLSLLSVVLFFQGNRQSGYGLGFLVSGFVLGLTTA